jgi:hypothetical protein
VQLLPDLPIGRPSFDLSEDQIGIVVDLLCRGAAEARTHVTAGMLEVPITTLVKKAMRRLKRQLSLTNLEIIGEFELLEMSNDDPEVLGRIDIVLKFLHQFGDEEAYIGVECKRVADDASTLNLRYVTQGVERFASAKYGAGHEWGLMLGYVLKLPIEKLVASIDARITKDYGDIAKLGVSDAHIQSLCMREGVLLQGKDGHEIRLIHIFVDMTEAADFISGAMSCTPTGVSRS